MESRKHKRKKDSSGSSDSESESSKRSSSNNSVSEDSEASKYEVEYICGKKCVKNESHYLVKWKELSRRDNTWEKYSHLKPVKDKLYEFEHKTSKFLFKKHLMYNPPSTEKRTEKPIKEKLSLNKEKSHHRHHIHRSEKITNNKTIKINKNEKTYGSFDVDEPKLITNHRLGPDYELDGCNCLYFKVEWDQSSKIRKPLGSYFSLRELRRRAPAILLDYFINNSILFVKESKPKEEQLRDENYDTSESNFEE